MVKTRKLKPTAEVIFWLHTLLVIVMMFSGLFISVWWVILILLLVKAQQIIFHGCILTIFEANAGGIKKGHAYFQQAIKRFSGLNINHRQVQIFSFGVNALTLIIAITASHYNFRVHL